MSLTAQLQEAVTVLRNGIFDDMKRLLEDQALIMPGGDSLPPLVSIKDLAERWECKRETIVKSWKRKGLVSPSQNKNGLLFTRESILKYEKSRNR